MIDNLRLQGGGEPAFHHCVGWVSLEQCFADVVVRHGTAKHKLAPDSSQPFRDPLSYIPGDEVDHRLQDLELPWLRTGQWI
jgi:hypothetical protein